MITSEEVDESLLWQALGHASWPLVIIDGASRIRFANPEGRAWLRESGIEPDTDGLDVLSSRLPADAERVLLDGDMEFWLVQRRRGPAQASTTNLLDADGLAFRLERTLDTALRLGQTVSVTEFTLGLYHEIESLLGRREAGAVLDQIRDRVKSCLRRGEFAGHLGNGRLIVVSIAHATPEIAFRAAAQWLEWLARPFRVGPGEHAHSVSAGVAIAPGDGRDAAILLDHAAAAAFSAAKHGRGTVWPFSESMARRMQDDMVLESALAQALSSNEFQLVYQPKVSLIGGELQLIGCEALARWQSPSLGNVPPSRFIPIAERSGLMPELGRLVLEQACAQIADWRSEGWFAPPVAVNVSNHELNQSGFRTRFGDTLKQFGIEHSALQIEITESALLQDVEHGIHLLNALKAEGIGLAIDDFGTGYSSLAYLRRFPADVLKIDRSFVIDAENESDAREVLGSIIRLADALKMSVIAEGVETTQQRDILLGLGCTHFQGYLFGRPMLAKDLAVQWAAPLERANERRA